MSINLTWDCARYLSGKNSGSCSNRVCARCLKVSFEMMGDGGIGLIEHTKNSLRSLHAIRNGGGSGLQDEQEKRH